jgi:hypothetical protein
MFVAIDDDDQALSLLASGPQAAAQAARNPVAGLVSPAPPRTAHGGDRDQSRAGTAAIPAPGDGAQSQPASTPGDAQGQQSPDNAIQELVTKARTNAHPSAKKSWAVGTGFFF